MKITSQLHALAILTLYKVPAAPTGFEPLNIPEKKNPSLSGYQTPKCPSHGLSLY
jgi:hypothetical protein